MGHPSFSKTGAAIPTIFYPKEVLYVSVIFQRHPCSQLLEFSLFFKKTAVLGACICKPLSYLVTREAAQDAEPALSWSSLPRAAQGKLAAQPAQTLDISTKVAT